MSDAGLPEKLERVIVTMVGHDETYANTVHARHMYYPDQIICGEDFVDVISIQDGRFIIDFRQFHSTKPAGQDALEAEG